MNEKKYEVYTITNVVNKKQFVGCSLDSKRNYRTHLLESRGKRYGKRYMYKEMELYGKEYFLYNIKESFDTQEEAMEYKKKLMEELEPEYNGDIIVNGVVEKSQRTKKSMMKPKEGKTVIRVLDGRKFKSIRSAAIAAGCTRTKVGNHCHKNLKDTKYEGVFKDVK